MTAMSELRFTELVNKAQLSNDIRVEDNIFYVDTEVEFNAKTSIVKILGVPNLLIKDKFAGISQPDILYQTIIRRMDEINKGL